jgi:hypothetical protein
MNSAHSAHVVYHLARADFLERVRRYSFLVMLGLIVFLGYQVAIGNATLQLGQYRGEFNSAWVGALMSLTVTTLIGLFGFYLVTGSVARDRETGVGQIMATTPLTRPLYMLGKWLSNFAVLMAMVAVLALVGIVLQFWKGESTQINLVAYLTPYLFIVIPLMALVAAFAVLFEAIPFLQGGFGNIVYFVAFMISLPLMMLNLTAKDVVFEPTGIGILKQDMGAAVRTVYPDYNGSFSFTLGPAEKVFNTFTWTGVHWTPYLILARFSLFGLAILLTLFAALFFDRFDPSRSKPKRTKNTASSSDLTAAAPSPASASVHLTPLNASANRFSFVNVLLAELKLLLKGQRRWWYAIAGGLIFAGLVNSPENARTFVLPFAWVWPILIWSGLGNREIRQNTHQMIFSSAIPLWRQLPATWLAGFIVTLLTGSGVALKLLSVGDGVSLLAWFSTALFIPSLALASGVWSRSSKLFEILYILIWYIGPLNKFLELDFIGANNNGRPEFFIPVSMVLIAFAILGRARQVRN